MPTVGEKLDEMQKADRSGQLDVSGNDGVIEKALNTCLKVARRCKANGNNEYVNVLFIGDAGSGKTSRIKAWAQTNGIHLKEVHTADLDQTDMGGAVAPDKTGTKVTRLSPTEMNSLNEPNSVLFLDEYNRGIDQIRGTLLTLIENHTVYDNEAEGFRRELDGFLFTIAAVNPFNADYVTQQLDAAEESRFRTVYVDSDPILTLKWFEKKFAAPDYAGARSLAKAILTHRDFTFTQPSEMSDLMERGNRKPLSARTLTRLLVNIVDEDGGATKENLLEHWDEFCDANKKAGIERILANYKDVDDKANQLLKDRETGSEVFQKRKSIVDQLKALGSN